MGQAKKRAQEITELKASNQKDYTKGIEFIRFFAPLFFKEIDRQTNFNLTNEKLINFYIRESIQFYKEQNDLDCKNSLEFIRNNKNSFDYLFFQLKDKYLVELSGDTFSSYAMDSSGNLRRVA